MPVTVEIDREKRLLCFVVAGVPDTDEMLRVTAAALDELEGETGYDVLSDSRSVDTPLTPAQAKALIAVLDRDRSPLKGRKAAMVVGRAASYGMMRMLGALATGIGIEVGAFWNPEDATRFLGR